MKIFRKELKHYLTNFLMFLQLQAMQLLEKKHKKSKTMI